MGTMTWPSGLAQTENEGRTSCRVRPLPHTVRPCDPVETAEIQAAENDFVPPHDMFPVHHVAAWCVIGTVAWAAIITASRVAVDILTHLG